MPARWNEKSLNAIAGRPRGPEAGRPADPTPWRQRRPGGWAHCQRCGSALTGSDRVITLTRLVSRAGSGNRRISSAVEQRNHNPLVGGSNPPFATICSPSRRCQTISHGVWAAEGLLSAAEGGRPVFTWKRLTLQQTHRRQRRRGENITANGREVSRAGAAPWSPGKNLVGVRGFEPPTPASRTQYSTRLSYTPKKFGRHEELCRLGLRFNGTSETPRDREVGQL